MQRDLILQFIAEYLNIGAFPDSCVNGLQVEGRPDVRKIVLGVSANLDLIRAAARQEADMLIVHHGLFWGKRLFELSGIYLKRLRLILKHEMNLAAYHLPLDAHPVIGNNITILQRLGLTMVEPFDIGFIGKYSEEIPFRDFVKRVNTELNTDSYDILAGKKQIKTVAVLSGGSCKYLDQAIAHGGIDVFLCGDIKEFVPATCKEAEINFVNAWHHNTEQFGVQELGKLIEKKLKIPTTFINIANEV